LASNRLKDDDILPLTLAIGQSSVTMLDLKSNHITDVGVQQLAANLPPQLETLWLLGNPFGQDGAKALLEAIEHHHWELTDCRIPTYSMLAPVPELQTIQKQCHYYHVLNQGGRRILTTTTVTTTTTDDDDEDDYDDDDYDYDQHPLLVPLGLWALILARVNGLEFGRHYNNQRGRLDVLYYHLRNGPALLER
jgi:hypothetical protein